MRWIRITAPSTLAVLLGCSAAVTWKETCGCIPDWANLAMELNINVADSGATLTPKILEDTLKTRFGKERVDLQKLRAIGPVHDESCVKSWYTRYECTYWLWDATGQRRGIRVELVSGGGGLESVHADYVTAADTR